MLKFKVTGMTCAACSARVERAVKALDGACDVSVNLLTGDLRVDGAKAEEVVNAVRKAAPPRQCLRCWTESKTRHSAITS